MIRIKKIVVILLIIMEAFSLMGVSAYAIPPSSPHIESGTATDGGNFFEFDSSYLGESGWRDLKTPPHWVVETGEVAYCLTIKLTVHMVQLMAPLTRPLCIPMLHTKGLWR